MTCRQRAGLGLAVLVALLGGHGALAQAGELRGRILLGDRPAAGVAIAAVPDETPIDEARRLARRGPAPAPRATATTGPDGTFVLTLAAGPGSVRLLASGGGLAPAWIGTSYDAADNEDLGEQVLRAPEKRSGRVVGPTGAPVAGAEVTIESAVEGVDRDVSPAARTVTTGPDGTFRCDDAPAGPYRVTVEAKGYATVSVRDRDVAAALVLRPGSALSGTVLRSDRKTPAAGVLVRFEAGGLATRWVEAGADGAFRLADLPAEAGEVVVEAGDAGFAQAAAGPGAPARPLALVLVPPATLAGRVVDAKSQAPVARARISVVDGSRPRTARSGADGRYELRGLRPQRTQRLRADEPRYTPYVRDGLRLAMAETKRVDVALQPAATIAGRVVDEQGKPVARAVGRIAGRNEAGGGPFREFRAGGGGRLAFRTAADGTFKATRLPSGNDQRLAVVHPDFLPRTMTLSLPPGSARTGVTIVLQHGLSLTGLVRDEASRPVAGAEVEVGFGRGPRGRFGGAGAGPGPGALGPGGLGPGAFGPGGMGPALRRQATTGPDGLFEVKGLTEGEYVLSVSKDGFADQTVDSVRVQADTREPVLITLASGAAIRGTLVRADGTAAEGYLVRAVPSDEPRPGRFGGGALSPTGPDGAFAIEGLRLGDSYDVVAFSRSGLSTRREGVTAPADGLEIVVPSPGRIAGRVLDAQTLAPITDFRVDVLPDRSADQGGGRGGGGGGPRGGPGGFGPGRGRGRGGAGRDGGTPPSEDGRFVLDDVPAGTWQVVAQAKGYQAGRTGGIALEEGQTKDGVEVRLVRGTSVQGRVLDAKTGTPIADALVTLQRPGGAARALAILMGNEDNRTDTEGRFVIDGLAPGPQTVLARHPDYAEGSAFVDVKEGPATVDVRLTPGGALGGTVLSETGAPLPAARVTLSAGAAGGFGGGAGGQTTTTDGAGHFRFTHVTAGRYTLTASMRARQTRPLDLILQAGEARDDLTLSMAAGARIRGIVSGLPSALRGNVAVSANGPDGYAAGARAEADGSFELTGAPAGPVNLRATANDRAGTTRAATTQVVIAEGQDTAQVEIAFETGFALSGTVTRGGQAVEGATVSAALQGAGGRIASARTGSSGDYRLEGLLKGTYTVSVSAGRGRAQQQTLAVADDATLDLAVPSARLTGVVVEAGSQQPIADAVVQATSKESDSGGTRGAATDANGRFSLEDLDPSPAVVTVRKAGFQLQTREATPAEGGGDDLVFALQRGEGLGIQVRDAAFGVPLRGVQIRAVDARGTTAFAGNVTLDSEGRGEVPSLGPGSYSVAAYASGYAPAAFGASVPSPRIALPMAAGGGLEIHAGPQTLSNGSARVQVLTATGQPYAFSFTASDGRLVLTAPIRRIGNLGVGSYRLQLESGAGKAFDIQEGSVTVVTLP